MTSRRFDSIVPFAALAFAACGTTPIDGEEATYAPPAIAEPSEPGAPIVDPVGPTVEPTQRAALLSCESPERSWFVEQQNWWIDTAWLGVLGKGRLVGHTHLANNGHQLLRASDGAMAGGLQMGQPLDFSTDQTRVAMWQQEVLVVTDTSTETELFRQDVEGGPWRSHRVELSPDGSWLAYARCSEDGEQLDIDAIHLDGRARWTWAIETNDSFWCPGWASHNALEMDIAGDHVVAAEPGTGVVWVHSLTNGSARALEAHPTVPVDESGQWWATEPILDIALSPDGSELATSGQTEVMRRWSTSDLELIDERPVGWTILNLMTYTTPFGSSPLAYSPDGSALAFVDPDNSVRVLDRQTGEVALSVGAGSSEPPEHWGEREHSWGIASIGFDQHGSALVIVETGGTQLFGCPVEAETPSRAPQLTVSAPAEVRVGERWVFEVNVEAPDALVGISWAMDDWELSPFVATPDNGWSFGEPGEHTVRFVVDDGVHQVSDEIRVRVVEQ